MSAPTPGPWMLGEWDRNIFVYGGPNNDDIAEFNFADEHTVKITREEAIANARLFLAAPQMLAALVAIDAALCGGFDTQAGRMAGRKALIAVRSAIAHATPQ